MTENACFSILKRYVSRYVSKVVNSRLDIIGSSRLRRFALNRFVDIGKLGNRVRSVVKPKVRVKLRGQIDGAMPHQFPRRRQRYTVTGKRSCKLPAQGMKIKPLASIIFIRDIGQSQIMKDKIAENTYTFTIKTPLSSSDNGA